MPRSTLRSARVRSWPATCQEADGGEDRGAANVATIVERKTRYTVLFRNADRRSRLIMAKLIDMLSPLPASARRSLNFDRGLPGSRLY